jgi:hypothetical protein
MTCGTGEGATHFACDCQLKRMADLERRLALATEALEEWGCHAQVCVLALWEAGEPTEGGGYRSKFAGKWYQTRPVDETPKCDCGFEEALAQLEGTSDSVQGKP